MSSSHGAALRWRAERVYYAARIQHQAREEVAWPYSEETRPELLSRPAAVTLSQSYRTHKHL